MPMEYFLHYRQRYLKALIVLLPLVLPDHPVERNPVGSWLQRLRLAICQDRTVKELDTQTTDRARG
jgi:hypothetical protein